MNSYRFLTNYLGKITTALDKVSGVELNPRLRNGAGLASEVGFASPSTALVWKVFSSLLCCICAIN